jgi:hypothetical protein
MAFCADGKVPAIAMKIWLLCCVPLVMLPWVACRQRAQPTETVGEMPSAQPRPARVAATSVQGKPKGSREATLDVNQACSYICSVTIQLRCSHAEECADRCSSMATSPVCRNAVLRFLGCLRGHPVGHWECDPDGMAAIREPYCADEQAKAIGCLEAEYQASQEAVGQANGRK